MQANTEATGEAVVIVDEKGDIHAVSREACALLGRTSFQLLGSPWRQALEGAPLALDHSAAALQGGLMVCVLRDARARRRDLFEAQRRIGHDLHDGLGQILTGTAFLAKGLEAHVEAAYRPQAQRVVELINLAIARVRGLARGLSSLDVEVRGVQATLEDVVKESSQLLGVHCELKLDAGVLVDRPATVAQLHLIVREAITNAVRHGKAERVVVSLTRQGGRPLLTIEDNGVGIPDRPVEGMGLRIMRERASTIGGVLEVSRARVGTAVRCSWTE